MEFELLLVPFSLLFEIGLCVLGFLFIELLILNQFLLLFLQILSKVGYCGLILLTFPHQHLNLLLSLLLIE
jgi:hypothetical protein